MSFIWFTIIPFSFVVVKVFSMKFRPCLGRQIENSCMRAAINLSKHILQLLLICEAFCLYRQNQRKLRRRSLRDLWAEVLTHFILFVDELV